jgi:hypothetical protein
MPKTRRDDTSNRDAAFRNLIKAAWRFLDHTKEQTRTSGYGGVSRLGSRDGRGGGGEREALTITLLGTYAIIPLIQLDRSEIGLFGRTLRG